jgi:hypothetical protein
MRRFRGRSKSTSSSPPFPATNRSVPWHRRLEARVLICVTVMAGLALEITLVAADRIVTSHSVRRSADNLRAAQAVFYQLEKQRADFAGAQLRLIAEIPELRASIDTRDAATVGATAENYRRKIGAEFCIVTDVSGRWLGDPGWPALAQPPSELQAGIGKAHAGQS